MDKFDYIIISSLSVCQSQLCVFLDRLPRNWFVLLAKQTAVLMIIGNDSLLRIKSLTKRCTTSTEVNSRKISPANFRKQTFLLQEMFLLQAIHRTSLLYFNPSWFCAVCFTIDFLLQFRSSHRVWTQVIKNSFFIRPDSSWLSPPEFNLGKLERQSVHLWFEIADCSIIYL